MQFEELIVVMYEVDILRSVIVWCDTMYEFIDLLVMISI